MSIKINVQNNNKPVYDIVIERNFDNLLKELKSLSCYYKKICIVTDTNVSRYYLNTIEKILEEYTGEIFSFIFNAGETSKTLTTVTDLYNKLIQSKFERTDLLIALGGGVVGDLTGFAAATYVRGIDFIQIPTSLLAQVDSSVGGKTGVDFNQFKNMIGAFYHPKLVYININTLNSIPKREFLSGMAEVIKYGLIKDYEFFNWLNLNKEKIIALESDTIEHMIMKCCLIKKQIVEEDFYEKGERALLNFGHTIGHSVEKLMNFNLLHGECVSIGMAYALELSLKLKNISESQNDIAIELIKYFDLPVDYNGLKKSDIIDTLQLDKKMELGVLKFILLKDIGNAVIDKTISIKQLSELLHEEKEYEN